MSRPMRCRSPSIGARFLVRGGAGEAVEGKFRGRVVVIEFPDHAAALACYRSPEYAPRAGAADGGVHGRRHDHRGL